MVSYRASKVMNAPIKYVYDWATDFREDDNSFWGGRHRRIILSKSKTRCVYAQYQGGSGGKPKLAVTTVTMNPSKYSWHLDYYGEEDTETGEYRLSKLGNDRTKLTMSFKNFWKNGKGPSEKEFEDGTKELWDKYAAALETDYDSGKSAKS
jgi:hypothetical protein